MNNWLAGAIGGVLGFIGGYVLPFLLKWNQQRLDADSKKQQLTLDADKAARQQAIEVNREEIIRLTARIDSLEKRCDDLHRDHVNCLEAHAQSLAAQAALQAKIEFLEANNKPVKEQ